MHSKHYQLINSEHLEALPCALAKARGNSTARLLRSAEWLIRRKSDGRYLAVAGDDWLQTLKRDQQTQRACEAFYFHPTPFSEQQSLMSLHGVLDALGIDEHHYAEQHQLEPVAEPGSLSFAGRDRYQRPLWLEKNAAKAWYHMREAAGMNGITLEAISGYRGHAYQMGIFRRKLARGQTVADILQVNAAPGFSEHHSGRAIDIGAPNEPPAEESFEMTSAFAWLMQHAGDYGFRLSYPRNNPHGIIYEPWHWYYLGKAP